MPHRLRSRTLSGWHDPEAVHGAVAADRPVSAWLDGGLDAVGGRSVVAVGGTGRPVLTTPAGAPARPDEVFAALRAALQVDVADERDDREHPSAVGWIGWFGYEFGARALGLPAAPSDAPEAAFFFADRVIVFDHARRRVTLEWLEPGDDHAAAVALRDWADETAAVVGRTTSASLPGPASTSAGTGVGSDGTAPAPHHPTRWRHSADRYRALIAECQAAIARGDAYQLCLTNRVDVAVVADPVETYLRLRRVSASHHGGLLRFGDVALLSASPEQFLHVDRERAIATKPMKGTRPRSADAATDAALRAELSASEKERAENLMIVDLMRNDLGRVAEVGSVRVPSLHAVEEYPQVHQLVSTVTARLCHPFTALDAVVAAFPAGSMTGAPKERAMRILHDLEAGPRGVYSGAFGCLGVDGSADLAMVIRSIVLTPHGASIGTGGGITALSVADEEVEETRVKARALLEVLGAERPA